MQGTVPPRILKVSLVALLYTITFDLEPNSEITEKSRNVYIDIDLSLGYCVISVFFLIAKNLVKSLFEHMLIVVIV